MDRERGPYKSSDRGGKKVRQFKFCMRMKEGDVQRIRE